MTTFPTTCDQLAHEFRKSIQSGRWSIGKAIPPSRTIAREFNVSHSAVHRALTKLRNEGLIDASPRQGWFPVDKSDSLFSNSPQNRLQGGSVALCMLNNPSTLQFMDQPESWTATILSSMSESLAEQGINLTFVVDRECDKPGVPEATTSRLEEMGNKLLGVAVFQEDADSPFRQWLQSRSIPHVCIGRYGWRDTSNCVTSNFLEMGKLGAFCFAAEGIKDVWYLSDNPSNSFSEQELLFGFCGGYVQATGGYPRQFRHMVIDDTWQPGGYRATLAGLEKFGAPHAIFCTGDYMAMGAIRALQEKGLNCPSDVRIIGANGLDFSAFYHPSLTTLNQPMKEIGKEVVSMLLDMIGRQDLQISGRVLPTSVSFRESFPETTNISGMMLREFPGVITNQQSESVG